MPSGVEDVIKEFESVQYSYPFSPYSQSMPSGVYPNWTFDPDTLEVVEEDPHIPHPAVVTFRCSSTDSSQTHSPLHQVEKPSSSSSTSSQAKLCDNNPCEGIPRVESPSGINNINSISRKSCEIKSPCSHYTSSTSIDINNLNSSTSTQPSSSSSSSSSEEQSIYSSSAGSGTHHNNNIGQDPISCPSHKERFELLKQFESVTEASVTESERGEGSSSIGAVASQLFLKGNYIPPSPCTSGCSSHQFCESSPGGTYTDAPGLFHHLISSTSWKDQQHLTNCNRPSGSTNYNQINMSSSVSCGVSSSSIFGGLCSGNTRRPSMFTAKYRMREERKKVLKMSLGKVKRIEDPESFLRRSVLINNTIKRLQKEVREEKMMRHGGSYTSKLSSCSSYRKSFACSRLNEMHLSAVDEPDTGTNSLMDHDDDPPRSRSSPLDNLVISKDHHNSPSLINSRKRQLNLDDSEDDCDVQAVLSQIYIPPTPCIISSIDEDDNANDGHHHSNSSSSASSSTSTSTSVANLSLHKDSSQACSAPAAKKSRLSLVVVDDEDTNSLLTAVTQECSLDDDVDVDVDVVGDSEMSDWPTPPPVTPTSHLSSSSNCPSMTSSLSLSSVTLDSSLPIYTSSGSSCNMLNTSPYATGLGRVMTVMSDSPIDFPMVMDLPPVTRDSDSNPSASLTVSTTSLVSIPTILSPSSLCNGLMSPLPLQQSLLPPTLSNSSSSSSDDSNSSSDEDMNSSSETKENTCSLPLSLPLSGIHSPLADRNSKCTTDSNSVSNNNNNNHNNANSMSNNNNANIINNNNNSMINSQMSETDKGQQQQQYSSCGHSSIFGELQSVVFHSLIASLES